MGEPLPTCYLNGDYLPLRDARISPLDRGFLYSDGCYEVTPVYGGRPFRFQQHHDRLTALIEDARRKGARVLEIGAAPAAAGARKLPPTPIYMCK